MRRALVALLGIALLAVSGCGGTPSDAATTRPSAPVATPSATPSASPLPSGIPSATPVAPAAQRATPKSAAAFSRYLLELVLFGYMHRDMAGVHRVAVKASCTGCGDGDTWVASERSRGIFQVPNEPARVRKVVNIGATQGVYDVLVEFDQSAGREVTADGTVKKKLPKASNSHLEALLKWDAAKHTWRVQNYSLNWGN